MSSPLAATLILVLGAALALPEAWASKGLRMETAADREGHVVLNKTAPSEEMSADTGEKAGASKNEEESAPGDGSPEAGENVTPSGGKETGRDPGDEKGPAAAAKPGVPLKVEVSGGKMSVEIRNQPLGAVLKAVADAAGFEAEVSNDVYSRKLSTRFEDVGLERGLERLFSLAEHKNYVIGYDADGSIREVKVFGKVSRGRRTLGGSVRPASGPPAVVAPKPARTRRAPARRPEVQPSRRRDMGLGQGR